MTIYSVLGSSLLAEWAADQPSTIYEDTGGTDAAEDGDMVAAWRSTSNSALSSLATQSTSGDRPIYRSNYAGSGYPCIEFDGSGDALIIPHHSSWNASGVTAFCVCQADVISNWRFAWLRSPNQVWTGQGLGVQASNLTMFFGAGWYITGAPISTAAKSIIWGAYGGPTGVIGANGLAMLTNTTTGTPTSHTATGGIGNGNLGASGNYPWDGAIHHLLICSRALMFTEIEYVLNALGDRWGISITDPPSIGGTSRPSSPFLQQVIG